MSKHADLANRIWRTVVVAGAMLATPAVAESPQEPPAQQAKPSRRPPDTYQSVSVEIEANTAALDRMTTRYIAAQNDRRAGKPSAQVAVDAAKMEIDNLRTSRESLETRLADLTRPKPTPAASVVRLEKALAVAERRWFAELDATAAAKPAALDAAIRKLEAAQTSRKTTADKLKAERIKLAKRPRANDSERPVGRGFVLA